MGVLSGYHHPGTREGLILVSQPPPNEDKRRAELADFLRAKRDALQPEQVGLPAGGRRRTPGLRREEVAQLAGVGITWYTWLEQGRDVRASLSVLDGLAAALQLTPAERSHLVVLGRGEQAPPLPAEHERVSPTLRRMIANLDPNPAYLLGRRWDLLAWNEAFAVVFGDPALRPPEERNQIWLTFMDPGRRELVPDWEAMARRMLSKFRASHAQHVGDPAFERLVEVLTQASAEFRRLWARHEVSGSGEGRKELHHPLAGRLVFDHAVFRHAERSEQQLVMYSPIAEHDTPERLQQLLDDRVLAAA